MAAKATVQLNLRIPIELRKALESARTPAMVDGYQPRRLLLSEVVIGMLQTATTTPAPAARRTSSTPATARRRLPKVRPRSTSKTRRRSVR